MLELDFSIRDTVSVDASVSSVSESESPKRKIQHCLSSVDDDSCFTHIGTPEHVKRLRVEIDNAFNDDAREVDGFELLSSPNPMDEGRPSTPQELLDLREIIESEHPDVPNGPVDACMERPEKSEDPFKHAGLMREYGGLKNWMLVHGKTAKSRAKGQENCCRL